MKTYLTQKIELKAVRKTVLKIEIEATMAVLKQVFLQHCGYPKFYQMASRSHGHCGVLNGDKAARHIIMKNHLDKI